MDPFSKLLFCCCSIVVLGCERRNTHVGEVYWHKTWLVICVLVVIFFFLTLYSWLLWLKTDVDAEFVSQVPIQVYRDPGTGQKKTLQTIIVSYCSTYVASKSQSIHPIKILLLWRNHCVDLLIPITQCHLNIQARGEAAEQVPVLSSSVTNRPLFLSGIPFRGWPQPIICFRLALSSVSSSLAPSNFMLLGRSEATSCKMSDNLRGLSDLEPLFPLSGING